MNDESNDWLKSATKIYGLAAMKMYPETVAKHTEQGERPIVILNKDDWSTEIGKLTMAGYKWSSNNDLNSSNDITNMSNYVKFPYIIYVNDDNKTVDYRGEHTDLK